MANVNLAMSGGINDVVRFDGKFEWRLYEVVFDAAKHPIAQNEIANLIDIPAQTFVERVQWRVEKVEGGARSFALGDDADDDGYVVSTTANTLAEGVSQLALTEGTPNIITGLSGGKYYSANDTLDLKAMTAGGLTACKIRVRAVMCHFLQ